MPARWDVLGRGKGGLKEDEVRWADGRKSEVQLGGQKEWGEGSVIRDKRMWVRLSGALMWGALMKWGMRVMREENYKNWCNEIERKWRGTGEVAIWRNKTRRKDGWVCERRSHERIECYHYSLMLIETSAWTLLTHSTFISFLHHSYIW